MSSWLLALSGLAAFANALPAGPSDAAPNPTVTIPATMIPAMVSALSANDHAAAQGLLSSMGQTTVAPAAISSVAVRVQELNFLDPAQAVSEATDVASHIICDLWSFWGVGCSLPAAPTPQPIPSVTIDPAVTSAVISALQPSGGISASGSGSISLSASTSVSLSVPASAPSSVSRSVTASVSTSVSLSAPALSSPSLSVPSVSAPSLSTLSSPVASTGLGSLPSVSITSSVVPSFSLPTSNPSATGVPSASLPTSSLGGSSSTSSSASAPSGSCGSTGTTYTDASGKTYVTACNSDLSGHKIGSAQASSFNGCYSACSATPGCVAFSYLPGTCYLKDKAVASTSNPNNAQSAYLASAAPGIGAASSGSPGSSATSTGSGGSASSASQSGPTSSSTTSTDCEAVTGGKGSGQISDPYGNTYNVSCKHDIPGGDLQAVSSPSFQGCFAPCAQNPDCVGFSWLVNDGPGTCYLKSSQGNALSTSAADVVVKINKSILPSSVVPSGSSPSATGSAGVSCKQAPKQVGLYTNTCGVDRLGGDFLSKSASSFSGCYALCDARPQCVGFAYVGGAGPGTCYLKSTLTAQKDNSGVDVGVKARIGSGV